MDLTQSVRMGDGACTAASSLTDRVTIRCRCSLTDRVPDDDVVVAVGHAMVTRSVNEAAAD